MRIGDRISRRISTIQARGCCLFYRRALPEPLYKISYQPCAFFLLLFMERSNVETANTNDCLEFLRNNGIETLYHFTDRLNIASIVRHKGLYSWDACQRKEITISHPGGNELSRQLDRRYHLENFVRLSFCGDHPMLHNAVKDGRIRNPIILEIDPAIVCNATTVKFSNMNATDNFASIGVGITALCAVDFSIMNQNYNNLDEEHKKKYQAEVLIEECVPLKHIREPQTLIQHLSIGEIEEIKQFWESQLKEPQINRLIQDDIRYADMPTPISWRAESYTSATINGKSCNAQSINIDANQQTCKLIVLNEYELAGIHICKQKEKTIHLRQYNLAEIQISIEKDTIIKDLATLIEVKWEIKHASHPILYFNEQCIDLPNIPRGSHYITVADTTRLHIEVTGEDRIRKFRSKDIVIKAKYEATIKVFASDRLCSYPVIPIGLKWEVHHANKVWWAIDENVVETIPSKGILDYIFKESAKITIYAEDDFSIKQQSIKVIVLPLPEIKMLSVPLPTIDKEVQIHINRPHICAGLAFPKILEIEGTHFQTTTFKKPSSTSIRVEDVATISCPYRVVHQTVLQPNSSIGFGSLRLSNLKNIADIIIKKIRYGKLQQTKHKQHCTTSKES